MKPKSVKGFSLFILFLLMIISVFSFAQEPADTVSTEDDNEKRIEFISGQTESEVDYTDLFQELEYLRKRPINLNNATADELKKLYFLNEIQISNLLTHIQKNGKLLSVYELQSIDGFDLKTINDILPYIRVSGEGRPRYRFGDMFKEGGHDIFLRYARVLEQQKGFSSITDSALAASPNSRYLGSPDKIYLRYRYKFYNKISVGFTAEKDAGEQFFKGAQKYGFDFYSGHLMINNLSVVKSLILGDYLLQFGQGLTLWSGLSFGKSGDVVNIKKMGTGFRPYTSVNESAFMRGGATTFAYKGFELTGFYSQKKVDANVTGIDSVSSEVLYISSVQETGLHSTPAEVADRHALTEQVYGGHLQYSNRRVNVGFTACRSQYSAELRPRIQPYNQFEFSGKSNLNLGVDYSFIFRNINFFGEFSRSENGGMALLDGLMISLDRYVSLSVLYRKYQRNYHALYTAAFSEGSKAANEEGIYTGIAIRITPRWQLSGYCDFFDFPWLRYRVHAPSRGQDYLAELLHKPNKKLEMYLRYRYENKQLNNTSPENIIYFPEDYHKQSLRFHLAYQITKTLTLKDRIEFLVYKKGENQAQNGFIVYQDVRYKPEKFPVALSTRYMLFHTDSYDARIYAYENDVLYYYSIPAFYYKGSRFYVMIKTDIGRHFDFWLRYAVTFYSNRKVISSGLSEIQGNTKSEIKLQVRMKF